MHIEGLLRKLAVEQGNDNTVLYHMPLGETLVSLNEQLGKLISLEFSGKINCIACNRLIPKSYQQGYCFPCTRKLAQCDFCILQPNRCHFHLGTCREPEWGVAHCMIPHWVYLANTSGLKVGITRAHQAPTRWMDQGAIAALPIFEVKTRQQSGFLEAVIASEISDKTHWQKMLKGQIPDIDLKQTSLELNQLLTKKIAEVESKFESGSIHWLESKQVYNFKYPVLQYPLKVIALNLDKTPLVSGKLLGIKGQYLILADGVINIRKYTGYNVTLNIE
jgi:hypothetical protein